MFFGFRALHALPIGNPADASLLTEGVVWEGCDSCAWLDALSFRAGLYGDYVFDRNLEVNQINFEKMLNTTLYTNAGYFVLNICDIFDLFTTLGSTKIRVHDLTKPFSDQPGGSNFDLVINGASHFSWSMGGRATLWRCRCVGVGIEGQYFSTGPLITSFVRNGSESLFSNRFSMHYREWQLGLGVTYRVFFFAPYVAVKYSGCRLTFNNHAFLGSAFPFNELFLKNLRNSKRWGWALGCSLIESSRVSFAVEGRFADEQALYINGQIRF